MKVYTKFVIDMNSIETVKSECYEYDGPIAECKGGGGGGTTTTQYVQSPEQREIYQKVLPAISKIGERAEGIGGPLWTTPDAPEVPDAVGARGIFSNISTPSAEGVFSGIAPWQIPDAIAPTEDWYGDIAPEVLQSIGEPFRREEEALLGRLGQFGQLGSVRAGLSGTAGTALGELSAREAETKGARAWEMLSPGLMEERKDILTRNMAENAALRLESGMDYDQSVQMAGMRRAESELNWKNQLMKQQTEFGLETEAWRQETAERQFPYMVLPGLAGGTYSTPVVTQGGGGGSGASMAAGAGAGMISGAVAGNTFGPYGAAAGAVVGGVSGAMGGK